eukprot:gene13331-biopygen15572
MMMMALPGCATWPLNVPTKVQFWCSGRPIEPQQAPGGSPNQPQRAFQAPKWRERISAHKAVIRQMHCAPQARPGALGRKRSP